MKNLMFLTDDIEELDAMEKKLETKGIPRSHIHVFSKHEAQLESRDIPSLNDFSKRDVIRSGLYGALFGGVLSLSFLLASWSLGWTQGVGAISVGFASVAIFGFCTWEGGLWGIQSVNRRFEKFKKELAGGSYLLIIDASDTDMATIKETVNSYNHVKSV